jgi:chromosome partitioning protein
MKTIAFFNHKGGVGKSTLAFHLGHMLAEKGTKTLLVDLDPQTNLTQLCLAEHQIESKITANEKSTTLYGAVQPLVTGEGAIREIEAVQLADNLHLLAGSLRLADIEDPLAPTWSRCLETDKWAFRLITAPYAVACQVAKACNASLVIFDVGPNLGPLNRAGLISSDAVIVPTAPDMFSARALGSLGPSLNRWRDGWQERIARLKTNDPEFYKMMPKGGMKPMGYVVSRFSMHGDRLAAQYQHWEDEIERSYRNFTQSSGDGCLAKIPDFNQLAPMTHRQNKPVWSLSNTQGMQIPANKRTEVRQTFEGFASKIQAAVAKIV